MTPTTRYVLLLAVPLVAAVIANGGRTPLEWNLCVAAIGVLGLVYWFRVPHRDDPPALERHVTVFALLAAAYVAFQLLPLPLPLLRLLSPRRAEIADGLTAVMARPWFAPLSIEPAATTVALTTLIACVLCFLLVRELTWLALRRGSWVTVLPLIALGVVEGAVALWEAWSGIEVDGTYWNRNHLAGMLEMVLPLSLVWAVNARRRDQYARPVRTTRGMVLSLVVGVAAPMTAVLIIFLGVIASVSKMGYVAALFGLVVMGLVVALTRLSGLARWAVIAALPVLAVTGFVMLANQDVLVRLGGLLDSPQGATGEGRLPIWMDSLHLLAAYPLFGSGFGTYLTAFLPYQTSGIALHWTHAHNDYLELFADLGLVGMGVFGALILTTAVRAVRLIRTVRQSGADLAALGCLGGFAAIGLHSIVDFNLYIPANALLLAWIAGIAAGIPPPSTTQPAALPAAPAELRQRRILRLAAGTMSVAAMAMASSALVIILGASNSDATGEAQPAPTLDQRLNEVRKSPASPYAWLDLAETYVASDRTAEARASALNAVALGGAVPQVIRRAATVVDAAGDRRQAVALVSRLLRQTGEDDGEVFDWFVERRIPGGDVLAGLSSDGRALQAYLRYLMLPGTCGEAGLAWRELLAHHHPDGQLVSDYVSFVLNDCQRPGAAAQAWADYARGVAPGYRLSDWVFNGDFERDPLRLPYDWQWSARSGQVQTALDNAQAFSGARSLRMVFRGKSQTNYEGAWQNIAVTPGVYRFAAAVRTLDLKSADGIRFRIAGSGSGPRLDVKTEQAMGTTGWHTISTEVVVPEGLTLLRIQIVRQPGPAAEKEDALNGVAWVDAVTLSRVGSTGG